MANFPGHYTGFTIVIGVLAVIQMIVITWLLVNRAKRQQGALVNALLADISSKFINIPAHQVDDEITDAQRRICEFFDADFSVVWQWSEKKQGFFVATHVFSLGVGPQPPFERKEEDYPWVKSEVLAGRYLAICSLDDIPAVGAKDRESARKAGIKANLTVPLAVGGQQPHGIITLNMVRRERNWPGELIEKMQLIAEVFANALARKRADEERRESELRLSLAIDSAGAGFWELDWESQVFMASSKAREIFGYSSEEVLGFERFENSVHSKDRSRVNEEVRSSVSSGDPLHIVYRIKAEGRGERWIMSRGCPVYDAEGRVERLLGLSMDITERKREESLLHQMTLVVKQSPVLVVITDTIGKIVYVNQKFTEVTGYSQEDCLGKTPRILKSGESSPSVYQELWARLTKGETWSGEFHNRKKSGERYWESAIISPLLDEDGKVTHYIGIKEDITEEKSSIQALLASEKLNRVTFEQAAVGIAHVGLDGRWMEVNERLCEIVGYSASELTKLKFQDITHPDDLEKNFDYERGVLSGAGSDVGLEKRYIRKDGSEVWVYINASLVRSEKGTPKFFVILIEDITMQRKAQLEVQELSQTLAHTGRVTLLGNLASALAHELSQPLGAILRNAEAAELMLKDANPDWEEIKDIIEDILRDDQRAGQVIDKLRSLLKRGALELQPIDVADVINEVLTLVKADAIARKVTLKADLPSNLPMVLGDRIHLQQVLLNLLTNAMDALCDGSVRDRVITISARISDPANIEVRVCDNGPGISEDHFKDLFEPFFTTKTTGMGMGLPMSRTLIEAQKGRLWAENRPEGGACFCFTLKVT